jgi:hypothetical protein
MRKSALELDPAQAGSQSDENWLDVENIASVQVTSEDPAFPIDLVFSNSDSWRAAKKGEQVIRVVFDEPQTLHRISLRFSETKIARTQQFALRWSGPGGQTLHEIVRQQWNFSPDVSTEEFEDYRVNLNGVSALQLTIQPEITDGNAVATLDCWRLA